MADDLSAAQPGSPLGPVRNWQLRLIRAANITIDTDPALPDLYRTRFDGAPPKVRIRGRVVDQAGGRLIKGTGDGILAVFDGPGRGIRCALALRKVLQASGIEIRAGLHTGEVDLRRDDVGGIAVHIGARIMAAAGPGEVLVSRTVRDLVVGSDIALEDRGTHTLKGVDDQWQLFAAN
jgi:class 3 adenylate cyclase